jgi:hypothetical protein
VRNQVLMLLRQHLGAIRHARLSPSERVRVYVTFATAWTRRQLKPRTRLRQRLSRSPG